MSSELKRTRMGFVLILFKSIYSSIKLFIDFSLGEVLMHVYAELLIDVNLYSNKLGV